MGCIFIQPRSVCIVRWQSSLSFVCVANKFPSCHSGQTWCESLQFTSIAIRVQYYLILSYPVPSILSIPIYLSQWCLILYCSLLSQLIPFFLILSYLSEYSILSQPIPYYLSPITNLIDTLGLGPDESPSCTDNFLSDNMNFLHTLESKFLRKVITGFNGSIVCLQWAPKTHI